MIYLRCDVLKRTGPNGVDPNHHNANVMVKYASGNVVSHEGLVSGNMTPAEKALGFPKGTNASHTEDRVVTNSKLSSGDTMTITGKGRPCNSFKGYMTWSSFLVPAVKQRFSVFPVFFHNPQGCNSPALNVVVCCYRT